MDPTTYERIIVIVVSEDYIDEFPWAGLIGDELEAVQEALRRNDPTLSTFNEAARDFLELKKAAAIYIGIMRGEIGIHPGMLDPRLPVRFTYYGRDDAIESRRIRRRLRKARLRARQAQGKGPGRRQRLPKAQGPGDGGNGPSDGANDA